MYSGGKFLCQTDLHSHVYYVLGEDSIWNLTMKGMMYGNYRFGILAAVNHQVMKFHSPSEQNCGTYFHSHHTAMHRHFNPTYLISAPAAFDYNRPGTTTRTSTANYLLYRFMLMSQFKMSAFQPLSVEPCCVSR
jgi:hypothetical protein